MTLTSQDLGPRPCIVAAQQRARNGGSGQILQCPQELCQTKSASMGLAHVAEVSGGTVPQDIEDRMKNGPDLNATSRCFNRRRKLI